MNINGAIQALKSKWFYRTIHTSGFILLASYLYLTADWRVSIRWGLAYLAIALVVSHLLARLATSHRFQMLNKYLTSSSEKVSVPTAQFKDEEALVKARYLQSFFNHAAIFFAPAEDALVCVPVLLVGINPWSALLGGVAFGAIHLGGYSYLECIAKAVYYMLIVWIVLPHGLLTVILGHLIVDASGLLILRIAVHQLSKNSELQTENDKGSSTS